MTQIVYRGLQAWCRLYAYPEVNIGIIFIPDQVAERLEREGNATVMRSLPPFGFGAGFGRPQTIESVAISNIQRFSLYRFPLGAGGVTLSGIAPEKLNEVEGFAFFPTRLAAEAPA